MLHTRKTQFSTTRCERRTMLARIYLEIAFREENANITVGLQKHAKKEEWEDQYLAALLRNDAQPFAENMAKQLVRRLSPDPLNLGDRSTDLQLNDFANQCGFAFSLESNHHFRSVSATCRTRPMICSSNRYIQGLRQPHHWDNNCSIGRFFAPPRHPQVLIQTTQRLFCLQGLSGKIICKSATKIENLIFGIEQTRIDRLISMSVTHFQPLGQRHAQRDDL